MSTEHSERRVAGEQPQGTYSICTNYCPMQKKSCLDLFGNTWIYMVHLNTSVTNIQIIQKARPGTVKDVNELKEELVIL